MRRLLSTYRANKSLNASPPHETWYQWAAKIREREQLQQRLSYHEGQLAKHRSAIAGIRHKIDIGDNSFNVKDSLRRRRKAALAAVVTKKI